MAQQAAPCLLSAEAVAAFESCYHVMAVNCLRTEHKTVAFITLFPLLGTTASTQEVAAFLVISL